MKLSKIFLIKSFFFFKEDGIYIFEYLPDEICFCILGFDYSFCVWRVFLFL